MTPSSLLKTSRYLILLVLVSINFKCADTDKEVSNVSASDIMRDGYELMEFISTVSSKQLNETDQNSLDRELENIGFVKRNDVEQVKIGNEILDVDTIPNLFYRSDEKGMEIFVDTSNKLSGRWEVTRRLIDRYSGIQGTQGTYYLKLEPTINTSLNATFRSKNHIINLRKEFSWELEDMDKMTDGQNKEYIAANDDFVQVLEVFAKQLSATGELIYKPLNGRVLSPDERIVGFTQFWTEVKYNFAFFDQVPDLDWDQVLIEYLPKIRKDQSNLEYYKLMEEVCAKLQDGHTNIYLPYGLKKQITNVPIELKSIEGKIYITNMDQSLDDLLEIGSELISVNKVPVEDFIQKYKYPYISSSTQHIRRSIAVSGILEGPIHETVEIVVRTPSGQENRVVLKREPSTGEWVKPKSNWILFEYKKMGDISYVGLNSFGTTRIVEEFESHLDSIANSEGLIIDLRKNGGGNSDIGYGILSYLASKPFLTSKWKTREHRAAYKAWGSFVDPMNPNLGSFDREVLQTFRGDNWHESEPDTIGINTDRHLDIPVVILIGNNTASAAEDFLVAADNANLGPTVGDYTYGSSGQPLFIKLPGGGSARICTKRDTYPDGREFIGYGIKPQFLVQETLSDFLNGNDPVLQYALEHLKMNQRIDDSKEAL